VLLQYFLIVTSVSGTYSLFHKSVFHTCFKSVLLNTFWLLLQCLEPILSFISVFHTCFKSVLLQYFLIVTSVSGTYSLFHKSVFHTCFKSGFFNTFWLLLQCLEPILSFIISVSYMLLNQCFSILSDCYFSVWNLFSLS